MVVFAAALPAAVSERRLSSTFISVAGSSRSALRDVAFAAGKRRASAARSTACQVSHNTITRNKNGGVLLELHCNGIMEDNTIFENGEFGLRGNVTYTAQRAQNIVEERFAVSGVSPTISTVPPLSSAQLTVPGTADDASREVIFRKNRIYRHLVANVAFDAFTEHNGIVKLSENDIHTAPMGVLVTNGSALLTAERNSIHHCIDGIYFEKGGTGEFTENRISDCHLCGVYVASGAEPRFLSGNVVESCRLSGVMIDAGGRGSFRKGSMRRCGLAGITVFTGPTTPFHVSYEEARQSGIVSSTPTFEENVIEEGEVHGVLVLSVIGGSALRNPRADAATYLDEEKEHFPIAPPSKNMHGTGFSGAARGERLCAYFSKNIIQKNQLFGVFHDRFDHWDLEMIFDVLSTADNHTSLASTPRSGSKAQVANAPSAIYAPPRLLQQQRQSISTTFENGIKNAHGGYEVLLGTSRIDASAEHHRQRELKQVTFKENTISHSCIGFAAGYGCHPFLLRNKVVNNVFIGLLLRFGSAVMASGCEFSHNGLAGVHAASGAKGFLSKGSIAENNALCRPAGRPNDPRNLSDVIAPLGSSERESLEALDLSELDTLSPREVLGLRRASEQLTELSAVHRCVLGEGVQMLWELVCASSAGISLASGCVPSSLSASTAVAPATTSSSSSGKPAPFRRVLVGGLGGLDVPGYVRLCSADGGLGVWIEEGSRVTVSENTIQANAHAGVYFSTAIPKQHRTLHKFFSMSGDTGSSANGASLLPGSPHAGSPSSAVGVPKGTKNGVLVDGVTARARGRSDDPLALRASHNLFGGALERPLLATNHAGALFTSHGLCASGVMAAAAAVQRRASQLSSSEPNLDAPLSPQLLSSSFALDPASAEGYLKPPTAVDLDEDVSKGQRVDSIHYALIAGNVITRNGEYGVFLGISQTMRTEPSRPSARSSQQSAAGVSSQPTAAVAGQLTLSTTDVALMGSGDALLNGQDFHVIVEGNTVSMNGCTGIFCEHVVEILANGFIASRGALQEQVDQYYETIRTDLVLNRDPAGNAPTSSSAALRGTAGAKKDAPFSTIAVPQHTNRAFVVSNELSGNSIAQGEVTSRYVVVTGDGMRSLLQLDTVADVATSLYSSKVLVHIPVMAALLAKPPSSVSVWERNEFHDSKNGLHVCGYVGSQSLCVQRNHFTKLSDDAVLVEGHLSSCTLGTGNVFHECSVGVRIAADATRDLTAVPTGSALVTRQNDLRTRVFGNTFYGSTQASVLIDRCVGEHVLVHANEFKHHPYGTTALFLTNRAVGGALVQANTFRDSFSPAIISASATTLGIIGTISGSDSSQPSSFAASVRGARNTVAQTHTLVDNQFVKNFIGLLVCNGANPRILHNLFDSNQHTGLEIVGMSTHPVVEKCVFRNHCRPTSKGHGQQQTQSKAEPSFASFAPLAASSPSSPFMASASSVTTAPAAAMRFPDNGVISVFSGTFSVDLVPGNHHVLSPHSQVSLPSGVLLGPFAECTLTDSFFMSNDIGLDAARVAVPPSLATNDTVALVTDSIFYDSKVAGVLVRGHGDENNGATLGAPTTRVGRFAVPESGGAKDGPTPPETTLVKECLFMASNVTLDLCGDVVSMRDGFAAFRANTFFGSVHCEAGGTSLFAGNTFLAELSNNDTDGSTDDEMTFGHSRHRVLPPTSTPAVPAIVFHGGAKQTVEENTIAFRRSGLLVCPDASGHVRRNCFLACTTAVTVAPFSYTTVSENRMLCSRDCAILAYGGLVTGNEIFDAPTGIVLQPPSQYKAYNAIPSHKRSTTDTPLCTRNNIAACSGEGILVACSAKVEGNVVTKCKNGLNVLCPATMGVTAAASGIAGLTGPPLLTTNTVYDCENGIYMDNDSISTILDNNVFDNDFTGVLILGNATGTLQNNTISSTNEHGAVDVPPNCRVKMLGNVIRNQFSPAYNRSTRADRTKEHLGKRESIETDVARKEAEVAQASDDCMTRFTKLSVLSDDIANDLLAAVRKASSGTGGAAAGLVARLLLRRTVDAAVNADGERKKDELTDGRAGSTTATPKATRAQPHSATTAHVSSPSVSDADRRVLHRGAASTPRTSQAATQARKKAAEAARVADRTARTSSFTSPHEAPLKSSTRTAGATALLSTEQRQVIIHVLTRTNVLHAHSAGLALGESVARVLGSAPMSQLNLSTSITTSTSHLATTLRSQKKSPYIVIVIVDSDTRENGYASKTSEEALHLLHGVALAADKHELPEKRAKKTAAQQLVYLLHPDSIQSLQDDSNASIERDSPAEASNSKRMTLGEFAHAATATIAFHTGIEDALSPLKESMANHLLHPSEATRDTRSKSAVAAFSVRGSTGFAAIGGNRATMRDDSSDDLSSTQVRDGTRQKTTRSLSAGASSRGTGPTLSRERIGELLSKLTPEALGYASSEAAVKKKRRKPSVASGSGTSVNEGGVTTSVSAPRRKSTDATKAAKTGRPPNAQRTSLNEYKSPITKKTKRASLKSTSGAVLPPISQPSRSGTKAGSSGTEGPVPHASATKSAVKP